MSHKPYWGHKAVQRTSRQRFFYRKSLYWGDSGSKGPLKSLVSPPEHKQAPMQSLAQHRQSHLYIIRRLMGTGDVHSSIQQHVSRTATFYPIAVKSMPLFCRERRSKKHRYTENAVRPARPYALRSGCWRHRLLMHLTMFSSSFHASLSSASVSFCLCRGFCSRWPPAPSSSFSATLSPSDMSATGLGDLNFLGGFFPAQNAEQQQTHANTQHELSQTLSVSCI